MEKTARLAAFEAKMQTEEAQQIYKERAGVAEFPNAWIKEKMNLRQFRLRGVVKVGWKPCGLASLIIFASGFVFVGNPNGWLRPRRRSKKAPDGQRGHKKRGSEDLIDGLKLFMIDRVT